MKRVSCIDITSLDVLRTFVRRVKESGGKIILYEVNPSLKHILENSRIVEEIGEENIVLLESKSIKI